MESSNRKKCPVCGEEIFGRSDKKFCSDDCRTYFNNARYRSKYKSISHDKDLSTIYSTTYLLYDKNARFLLKFILLVTLMCKIFYTFGVSFSKNLLHHD